MKNIAIKTLLLSTMLTVASTGVAFADDYNWSGVFIGGTVGATESTSKSSVDYGYDTAAGSDYEDNADTYSEGWENGYFTGALYDDLDDLNMNAVINGSTDVATNSAAEEIGALQDWADAFKSSEMHWSATAILGAQMASGGLVYGAELRGTFGDFDTSTSNNWTESETPEDFASCTLTEDSCDITYTPPGTNVNWSDSTGGLGWNSTTEAAGTMNAGYEATYTQVNSMRFGANYDSMFTPVAKLGVAAGRVHLFAMGGPSWAKVTATTSARAVEDAHVDVFYNEDTFGTTDAGDFSGDEAVGVENETESYDWSGSNTKTMTGYSVGGGVEWAVTDNMIMRAEGLYTDLGTIRVTGASEDTAATYTVSQKLTNVSASAGILFKF